MQQTRRKKSCFLVRPHHTSLRIQRTLGTNKFQAQNYFPFSLHCILFIIPSCNSMHKIAGTKHFALHRISLSSKTTGCSQLLAKKEKPTSPLRHSISISSNTTEPAHFWHDTIPFGRCINFVALPQPARNTVALCCSTYIANGVHSKWNSNCLAQNRHLISCNDYPTEKQVYESKEGISSPKTGQEHAN